MKSPHIRLTFDHQSQTEYGGSFYAVSSESFRIGQACEWGFLTA